MNTNELLTRKELAELLKLSTRTIRNLEKKGLPFLKIQNIKRYKYSDVIKWIDEKDKAFLKGGDIHDR